MAMVRTSVAPPPPPANRFATSDAGAAVKPPGEPPLNPPAPVPELPVHEELPTRQTPPAPPAPPTSTKITSPGVTRRLDVMSAPAPPAPPRGEPAGALGALPPAAPTATMWRLDTPAGTA